MAAVARHRLLGLLHLAMWRRCWLGLTYFTLSLNNDNEDDDDSWRILVVYRTQAQHSTFYTICRSLRHHVTSDVTPRQVRVSTDRASSTLPWQQTTTSTPARMFALHTKWSANTQNTTFALSTINHKFSLKQAYHHHAPSALCSTRLWTLNQCQIQIHWYSVLLFPLLHTSLFIRNTDSNEKLANKAQQKKHKNYVTLAP